MITRNSRLASKVKAFDRKVTHESISVLFFDPLFHFRTFIPFESQQSSARACTFEGAREATVCKHLPRIFSSSLNIRRDSSPIENKNNTERSYDTNAAISQIESENSFQGSSRYAEEVAVERNCKYSTHTRTVECGKNEPLTRFLSFFHA